MLFIELTIEGLNFATLAVTPSVTIALSTNKPILTGLDIVKLITSPWPKAFYISSQNIYTPPLAGAKDKTSTI
jgi:hypothetical protein